MVELAVASARGSTRGLVAALLTASLMPLNSTMVAVAVPAISADVHAAPGRVTQALVATYLIAAIALQSPGGKLGDRLGHWRMFAAGQVAIALGAVLGMVAPNLLLLAGCRVLMAAGGAVAVPATVALLRLEVPPERRARAFGTFGAVMSLAAAAGPLLGGLLVDGFGWRAVFVANVPVLVVSALLAASVAHPPTPGRTTRFDWPGSVLLTLGLALVVLSAERGSPAPAVLLCAGLVVLLAFAVREQQAPDPVVAFDLFGSVPFTAGTVLIAAQNVVSYGLLFEVPLVLERLFRVDAEHTGQTLLFLVGATVVASFAAGSLTGRFGARSVAVVGAVVGLAGIAALALSALPHAGSLAGPLVLVGLGQGLTVPAAQTASLSAVAAARSGMAAGVSSTMRYLGGVVAIALLGRLLALGGDRAAVVHAHHSVMLLFVVAAVLALCCAVALPGGTRVEDR